MEYENYFVAFVDILGFKNMVYKYSRDEIFKIFSKGFKTHLVGGHYNGESIINAEDIKYKTMSDSIVFYVKENAKNALLGLLATCSIFQGQLLLMNPRILTRGGVSYGQFCIDGDIMFGPALTSAYLLENENAKYPRIIMNHSLLLEHGNNLCYSMVFEDEDLFWSVNYLWAIQNRYETGNKDIQSLSKYVSTVLDSATDSSIREKHLYLRRKINNLYVKTLLENKAKDETNKSEEATNA